MTALLLLNFAGAGAITGSRMLPPAIVQEVVFWRVIGSRSPALYLNNIYAVIAGLKFHKNFLFALFQNELYIIWNLKISYINFPDHLM